MSNRKIIHCDADCFFAAIEMRDNPALRHRPIAVGGSSERRGVISTCNYLAREFGVRSAMATAHAKRLCPQLVIVPTHMDKYRQAAGVMREVFHQYTELVEPLSLDEAFLDVTGCSAHGGSATRIATAIRQEIQERLGITVSAGVAANKFLAKIASDWNKPDGLKVIEPSEVEDFIAALPVNKIYGVGRVTAANLHDLGITTCGDLQKLPKTELYHHFGSYGEQLYRLARGQDERPVNPTRIRKSLSVEHTYAEDISDHEQCLGEIPELLAELEKRLLRLEPNYLIAKTFVKVKFNDFTSTTLERVEHTPTESVFVRLMKEALKRKPLPIRLLGLGVRFREEKPKQDTEQLGLFSA